MGLFKPTWKSTNREKALEALKPDIFGNEKLNMWQLVKVTKKAALKEVRKQAALDLFKKYDHIPEKTLFDIATDMIANSPFEEVREIAESFFRKKRYNRIEMLVMDAQKGYYSSMQTLLNEREAWGTTISICFAEDVLYHDSNGSIKTLISNIAITNTRDMEITPDIPDTCPDYADGQCNHGNQKCSLRPEWYPVCHFHESYFFDSFSGNKFLKGHFDGFTIK